MSSAMKIPMVDLKAQYRAIRADVDEAVRKTLEESAFILGKTVSEFEAAFAEYCHTLHAVGVNSGTAALHLALTAAGVGEGDEVITVPNTFIATAEAIAHTGARVVLVDVDPETLNMDVERLHKALTSRTRAIIPVHLYGNPADMEGICEVARSVGALVIEDAAQAHGALYGGRKVGSIGDIGCFSFYPGKNLGAYGDAGAVVTDDDGIARAVRMFSDHGRSEKHQHLVIGWNERLDAIQAAILGVKLRYIENWNASRRMMAELYTALLEDIPGIVPVRPLKETTPVYHLYVVRVEIGSREELRENLAEIGIATGIHYPVPLHRTPAFRFLGYREGEFPIAEAAMKKILSLPLYPEIGREEIQTVAGAIRAYVHSL
jgi:dTDP-4-amino-4,6-dideoxygalactose transaminase